MTPNFITQYHPLTARPFRRDRTYEEHIPCKQLRPYVACFWSSEGIEKSGADGLIRVIPDTCMDIIIEINYTKQAIKSCLCGIQDYVIMLEQGKEKEETVRFAVRFYFWAVRRFLNLDMSDLYNQTIDLDLLMPGCNYAFEELFYCRSFEERIAWMENVEVYFEEDDFDQFLEKLDSIKTVEYVHPVMEHAWGAKSRAFL